MRTSGQPPQKTLLITGATGFLGSHLVRALCEVNGYSIICLKRSTSNLFRLNDVLNCIRFYEIDTISLKQIFEDQRIDAVIHCATNYGRKNVMPSEMIHANLILPLQLLELAYEFRCQAFINTDTLLDKRVNDYSLSKKQFLDWLKVFSKRLVCTNVALEHFYGPLDDSSKFVSKVLYDLLMDVEQIHLTLGEQKRDFVYIDDVVSGFLKILDFSLKGSAEFYSFEVGSGQLIKIREFVELLKRLSNNTKTQLKFGAIPYRENEVMESEVSLSALKALGWLPQVSLEAGLLKTIRSERERLKS